MWLTWTTLDCSIRSMSVEDGSNLWKTSFSTRRPNVWMISWMFKDNSESIIDPTFTIGNDIHRPIIRADSVTRTDPRTRLAVGMNGMTGDRRSCKIRPTNFIAIVRHILNKSDLPRYRIRWAPYCEAQIKVLPTKDAGTSQMLLALRRQVILIDPVDGAIQGTTPAYPEIASQGRIPPNTSTGRARTIGRFIVCLPLFEKVPEGEILNRR